VEKIWNGRIYYGLDPAGTVSGRLASGESHFWCGVQIQNITRGETVKQCYIADDGWLLCEIDKKQSEARCVGYLSGEEKLILLVESDRDYHKANAEMFFGIPYDLVDKIIRDIAKRTNHGANYNMTGPVMLDTMGPKNVLRAKKALRLPFAMRLVDVCNFLLERYSKTYPKIKGQYYESIIKRITLSGMLVSALGWTRRFFGTPSKNKRDLNVAVAHEPQNLSATIVNKEFYGIWYASIYGELKEESVLRLVYMIQTSSSIGGGTMKSPL
jgi:DNA polymerase I-like protein with 3'-5' exonuclease and polymerase domains